MKYADLFHEAFKAGCLATAREMLPRGQYEWAVLCSDIRARKMWELFREYAMVRKMTLDAFLRNHGTSERSMLKSLTRFIHGM